MSNTRLLVLQGLYASLSLSNEGPRQCHLQKQHTLTPLTVDPNDEIYPKYRGECAEIAFRPHQAISVSTDLFILGIETGPKIIHDWDAKSLALLIFVIVAAYVIHQASIEDHHHDVFT
eukprot:TRINITY_DN5162_c0_g1_i3.p1 TRINITY_DN5162_c0_g1~~TRINITY_DN5162_c0_g1_i3.p1  ORF type:complete len:118 (+),score=15.13 TRINITY_DN5162_c0_g1_i3:213-566(+)